MTGASVTGPDGTEWVPAVTALDRVPGLSASTLRSWVHRGRVRSQRVGRQSWVAWEDVLTMEAAAHLAGWRRGGFRRQRADT
ncbi:hypothetical protein [Actinomyces ruminis]|uniref:Helix-turn-helix domain-containing protein n=1 Tax=Actinomyces ruminis TaxID=1937003 RepID=A0ABX4MAY4_9ACTO|nr:hypothetical protein [Actinomyces ruminis]PHP52583.1 hypothetical protein BW737_008855 [Actinomyces ruminis]